MNVNFMRAWAVLVAVGALMSGMSSYAADSYDQSTPSNISTDGSDMTPPPPPSDSQFQGGDNPDMMQQQGQDMDTSMPSQHGGMNEQPPGMSGGRSNAPMPSPSGSKGSPQSKRVPTVKSKAKVSKR